MGFKLETRKCKVASKTAARLTKLSYIYICEREREREREREIKDSKLVHTRKRERERETREVCNRRTKLKNGCSEAWNSAREILGGEEV